MQMKWSSKRKCRGLTLVEMVISIFTLAIITLTVLGIMTLTDKVGRQAEARNAAMAVARNQLELIRSRGNSAQLSISNAPFTIPSTVLAQFPSAQTMKMTGSYSVEPVAGANHLKRVTIVVNWGSLSKYAKSGTVSPNSKKSSVVLAAYVVANEAASWGPGGTTVSELFVPPPPPPPPPNQNPPPPPPSPTPDPGTNNNNNNNNSTPPPSQIIFGAYGGTLGLLYPTNLVP